MLTATCRMQRDLIEILGAFNLDTVPARKVLALSTSALPDRIKETRACRSLHMHGQELHFHEMLYHIVGCLDRYRRPGIIETLHGPRR